MAFNRFVPVPSFPLPQGILPGAQISYAPVFPINLQNIGYNDLMNATANLSPSPVSVDHNTAR